MQNVFEFPKTPFISWRIDNKVQSANLVMVVQLEYYYLLGCGFY